MPTITTHDGTRLHYNDWGAGKPMLFIHGWAMGADMWEYQLSALTEQGVRCITYDQRGCGRSDHPSHGYDFDTLADDLAALMTHLDLREVTLVGFSLGGGVLARYLTRHGAERVAGCVFLATNTPYLLKGPDNPEGIDRSVVYEPFLAGLQNDRPRLLAQTAPVFFGVGQPEVSVSPEIMQWGVDLCYHSSAKGMLDLYRVTNTTDFRSDLRAITVPTLVIHGAADRFAPPEVTARRTACAVTGSRLEIYPGAAHGLFYTHRERLNRDLLAFSR